jgi:RecA-family ATPase
MRPVSIPIKRVTDVPDVRTYEIDLDELKSLDGEYCQLLSGWGGVGSVDVSLENHGEILVLERDLGGGGGRDAADVWRDRCAGTLDGYERRPDGPNRWSIDLQALINCELREPILFGEERVWFALDGRRLKITQEPRTGNGGGATTDEYLATLDISAWDGLPVPERDWAVRDRIVRRAVTLLSGEGGVGKSIVILQLACAHVLERDWFGQLAEPGPVIYLNAEDDQRELHYRLEAIRAHLGVTFAALARLHLVPLAGEDALLGVPDRGGIIRPTPLFERLLRTAVKIRPVLIALDTAADCFGGNENDRSQVRQFIGHLRRVAIAGNSAVLLASHPSLSGINSDSGLSGSTSWHNSVRSRLFFKASEADDGARSDQRELIVRKNNYWPSGEIIRLIWRNGVFIPVATPSSIERAAAERKAEDLFLQLFDRLTAQGQTLNHLKTSPNYAPRLFAELREANDTAAVIFAAAMQRLLDAGTIRVETYGRPSRPYSKLVRR